MKLSTLFAITALGLISFPGAVASAPAASACTCMSPKRPVCEVWWQTAAVFVGRVTRLRTIEDETANGLNTRKVATFRIIENFLGIPRREREVQVRTGSGGGDCGFDFERDRTYLVYASRSALTNQLETGICSRTAPMEDAEADLAYLRGREDAEPLVSLYGMVYRERQTPEFGKDPDGPMDPGGPLADLELTLQGEGDEKVTATDEEGWYEFHGLAPGTYEFFLHAPDIPETERWTVRLPLAPACAWHDLIVPPRPTGARQ